MRDVEQVMRFYLISKRINCRTIKSLMDEKLENFEILYTERNTKALKKYNPVNRKYYKLPIISIGDDTIYSDTLVDTCYKEYIKNHTHVMREE